MPAAARFPVVLPPGRTRRQGNAPSGLDHLWGIAGDGFDICQQIAKLAVVNLNAIVEINTDSHISIVTQAVVIATQFAGTIRLSRSRFSRVASPPEASSS